MKPIAILNNGSIKRERQIFLEACGGDQDVVFAKACAAPVDTFVNFDIEGGEAPPDDIEGFSGVILTGSWAMITDRHPWAEAEAAWARRHRGRLPMLGVCFGHQLLTYAYGGVVDWMASGTAFGTVAVETTPAASVDPLFSDLGRTIHAQVGNSQHAVRLPSDAVQLASGANGIMAARFDRAVWGVQFHPEFTPAIMRGLANAYADHYAEKGFDLATLTGGLADTPAAVAMLRRFVGLCQCQTAMAAE